MKTYSALSKISFLKRRYNLKVLFLAFLGIHIPLFAIIAYLVTTSLPKEEAWTIGILTLIFTLIATAVTLFLLNKLLKPIIQAKNALNEYIYFSKMNELPTNYEDEVGVLMADVSQSINSLERSTLERAEFVQVLSHDLQSPLRTNIKLVDILEKEADNERIKKFTGAIKDSLQKNLDQLQSYLSDLKQHKLVIEEEIPVEPTDLNTLLEQIVAGQEEKANLKSISIVLNNQITNVKIPQKALMRALNNIIDNAIKFSTEDTKIKIDTELNDERLTVKVTDEGIGFDQEQGQSIFSFDQSFKNSSEESNGVGLYLVQKQLNRVGGEIKAESEGIGKGATFLINLEVA